MKTETGIEVDTFADDLSKQLCILTKGLGENFLYQKRDYIADTSTIPPTMKEIVAAPQNINRQSLVEAEDKLREQEAAIAVSRAGLVAILNKMDALDAG